MPEVAVSVRGVRVRFGSRTALDGVDLDLPRGGLTALIGPNGAGKTTLLRVLAGLQGVDEGTAEGTAPIIPGGRIGYIPQDVALDPEMTGRETLALLAALHGVPRRDRPARIDALARAFGFETHLGGAIAAWSGGLKRRLHLAAGMIHDPGILLLDEPTAGLDLDGNDALWAELSRRAAAGRTVAVVTHDLAAVERHATFAAILDRGRIVVAGPPSGLSEDGESTGERMAGAWRRWIGGDPEPPPGAGRGGGGRGRGGGRR